MGNKYTSLYNKRTQVPPRMEDAEDVAGKVKMAVFVCDTSAAPVSTDVVYLGRLPAGAIVPTQLAVMSGTFANGDVTPALAIGSTTVIASATLSAAAKQLTGGAGVLTLTADTDVKITVGAGLVPSDFQVVIPYILGA